MVSAKAIHRVRSRDCGCLDHPSIKMYRQFSGAEIEDIIRALVAGMISQRRTDGPEAPV